MDAELLLKNEERAVFRLRELYRRHGYLPYKMSKFEEYDLYVRNKSFLVSDHILTFTDVDGNRFAYEVAELQVLPPSALEDMLSQDWDLSLFTCTLGGQTRLTVRCDRAAEV